MAAPATTARIAPVGIPYHDGFSTLIAFELDPDLSVWEQTVSMPGIDGGDAIEFTSMHNVEWRTMRPRQLKTLTEFSSTCFYDERAFTQLLAIINAEGSITIHFPDGATYDFYGFLRGVDGPEHAEGTPPTMTLNIVPSNWDVSNAVEASPVLTPAIGT
jgi:hypothetical protein